MRRIVSLLLIIMIGICTGCGTSVANDLQAYISFQQGTQKELDNIDNELSQVTKFNSKEEQINLINDGKKKITAIQEKHKAYKAQTKEVQELNNKVINILDANLAVANDFIQAVQADEISQAQSDEITKKGNDLQKRINEYNSELRSLANKLK